MRKFNFEKDELEKLAEQVYLKPVQKKIIEYRMLGYSIVKMAELEHLSTSTISRELDKALYKISKKIK